MHRRDRLPGYQVLLALGQLLFILPHISALFHEEIFIKVTHTQCSLLYIYAEIPPIAHARRIVRKFVPKVRVFRTIIKLFFSQCLGANFFFSQCLGANFFFSQYLGTNFFFLNSSRPPPWDQMVRPLVSYRTKCDFMKSKMDAGGHF